ncbi:serine hydrolase domain-containing protein [Mumia zhuanghuii]|uniref:Serine hydrolase n=1 Tax=Mumia zhuanghuii TaxID=2585211 RepID=A0A5C4MXV6_9ACTN|nr:serine hydrolase domain-containing protein [Mumia zhuanghuii]TNC44665.1 serine hydrolase [Mumia zhuanghuii]TNC51019.1 serine hydrolase [Mumia zhuanghuii]
MRRTSWAVALAAGVAVVGAFVVPAGAVEPPGNETGPPTVTGEDVRFSPPRTLREGSPEKAGLLPEHIARIMPDLAAYLKTTPENPNYPMYAGAVALVAKDGIVVEHGAVGDAVRYASADGTELPEDQQIPMTEDTMFDLASVTKLFTVVVTLQLVDQGVVGLDTPVADYLPEFAQNGKAEVTVRHLLTHTSGLRSWVNLYSAYPTPEARIAAVFAQTLVTPPGTAYVYSDLGLITLGKLAERVTGQPLDQLVAERITEPLGMTDTMFNPPASLRPRIAATEDMSSIGRGMVHGEVHDENAWSLGGVAGHAGLFSTAGDLAVFSQMLLNGGRYGKERILSEDIVREAITDQNVDIPPAITSRRGLGFELNQSFYMASLDSPMTFGHTGFTGTSLVIDPLSRTFVILLTNRVHPNRAWGSNNGARQSIARNVGRAIPVRPAVGRTAWFSGRPDSTTHTLTAPLARPATEAAWLSFRLWYDTEAGYDVGRLEASTDGGTTWQLVPINLAAGGARWSTDGTFSGFEGRQWLRADAVVPAGATHLRWTYTGLRATPSRGRGMYVDGVLAVDRGGLLFNGQRPSDAARFVPEGWAESSN